VLALPVRAALIVAILAICAGVVGPLVDPQIAWASPLRFTPALCGGALLAFAHYHGHMRLVEKVLRYLLVLSVPGLIMVSGDVLSMVQFGGYDWPWRQGFLVPLACWLIARAVLDGPNASSWGGRVLPWLGAISYGVYVLHHPMRWFADIYDPNWEMLWLRATVCSAAVAFSWISYRYFEMPVRIWGRTLSERVHQKSTNRCRRLPQDRENAPGDQRTPVVAQWRGASANMKQNAIQWRRAQLAALSESRAVGRN
jgi:peptidoglycan/LPS O-acetylase OafA/YrhL